MRALYPSPRIGTFAVHQRNTNIDVDVENPDRDWHWQLVHVYITYARRTTTNKEMHGCISCAYPCPSEARREQTFMKRERSMHRCRLAHPARLGESTRTRARRTQKHTHTVRPFVLPHSAHTPPFPRTTREAHRPSPIAPTADRDVLRSFLHAALFAHHRAPCPAREARSVRLHRPAPEALLDLDHMYVTIKCNSTIN